MYVDTCLRIVPRPASRAVGGVGIVATTVACVFGVEDVVQLAEQTNLRHIGMTAPFVHRQLVLQIDIGGGVRFDGCRLVLHIVEILLARYVGLDSCQETCHIKGKERHSGNHRRESNGGLFEFNFLFAHPVEVRIVLGDDIGVVEDFIAREDKVTVPTEPIENLHAGSNFGTHTVGIFHVLGGLRTHIIDTTGEDKLVVVVHKKKKFSYWGLDSYTDVNGEKVKKAYGMYRKLLDNHFFGAIMSAKYVSEPVDAQFGVAANDYMGTHFGTLNYIQDSVYGGRLPVDYEFYRNHANKVDANVYAKANWRVINRAQETLSLYADLQYRYVRYSRDGMNDEDMIDLTFMKNYHFFNPKAGLTLLIRTTT